MKVIDGKNAIMGRIASFAAKEVLKGEEVSVVNCNEVLISGSREYVEKEFQAKRGRYGSSQKGPQISKSNEKMVKRAIRGMLPNHREGRGNQALRRVKCYNTIPKELESVEKISFEKTKLKKAIKLNEMRK